MSATPDVRYSTYGKVLEIQFSDIFDLNEIQRIQDLFSDATGVASIITYPDGTPITNPSNFCRLCNNIIRKTEKGLANCYQSDAATGRYNPSGPNIQPCLSAGLWNAGTSITVGGKHIANWLIGQVRNEELDEQRMVEYADEIGANREDFRKALIEVPVMSVTQFNKVAKMLFVFANELSKKAYNNLQLKMQIAEREKATELLQESEARYRSVLDAFPDDITITDMQGRILMISPSAFTLFGYDPDTVFLGRSITDFIVTEDKERASSNILLMLQGNSTGPNEYHGLHANGSIFDIEVNSGLIRDAKGQPTQMVFVVRDITGRKRAEEALRKSQAIQGKVVANIGDVIVIIDHNGIIRYKSPNIEKWFGWRPEELVGESTWENVHPEDLDSTQEIFGAILGEPNAAGTTECRYRCKDGSYKWIELTGVNLLHDPDIGGILGNYRDISKRKLAEKSLYESEERFRKAFITSPDSININCLEDGRYVDINEGFTAITGYTKEEIIGKTSLEINIWADESDRKRLVEGLKENGRVTNLEAKFITKDGAILDGQMFAEVIVLNNSPHILSVTRDITERKRAEEKILRANRLYAVISQINQTIIRTGDRDTLFAEVCRIAVEYGKFEMSWIGLIDEETKLVNPVSFAGIEDGYLSTTRKIYALDIPEGRGPAGTAMREGKHFVCDDIENNPAMDPWKDEALKRGYRSSIALPIKLFGKVIGVFNLYAATPQFFDQSEIELLDEVTSDISFALETIEKEKMRVEAEKALQKSDMRFQSFMQNFPGLAYMKDGEGQVVFANEGFNHYLGLDAATMPGKTNYDLFPAEFAEKITRDDRQVLESGRNETVEEDFAGRHWATYKFPIPQLGATPLLGGFTIDITERKRAEALLIESSERYKALIAVSNTGAWEYNLDTDFLWCSPEYFTMLGRDINQFDLSGASNLNETWIELLHIEDRQRASTHFSDYLNNGSVGMYENYFRMKHSDGHWVWILSRGSTLSDENGKLTNLTIGTHIDITERKLAEEVLRKSRNELEDYFENAISADYIISLKGEILSCNKTFLELFGFKEKSFAEKFNITHLYKNPADRKELIRKIKENGKAENFELDFITLEGETIHGLINAIGIFNDSGELINIRGYLVDITDRKKAEKKLLKLSRAVEQSPVSIVITDTKGNIEYSNPKVTEITGYQPAELVGKNPRLFSSGETPLSGYQVLWDTVLSGREWSGEFHNKKKNGELYWEYASITPIFNEKGVITHFLAVKEDITQRKEMIDELIKAKEHAEESDRLKSAFLANMSHEIRTPMNGILGFAEILKEPDLTGEQQQEYIGIIEKSGARMVNIINDIVDISKIESGQMNISISETNVNKQIEYISDFFKPEAEQKGIQLSIKNTLPDKKAILRTDKEKLYAILTNLVKNAIKFTNTGSIEIGYGSTSSPTSSSLRQVQGSAGSTNASVGELVEPELEFYVRDTGIGIRPEQKEIIFERFRQGSESLNRNYEGAGLGLAISKAYVEMLGGKIRVESEPGKGSVFYFTLPYPAEPE